MTATEDDARIERLLREAFAPDRELRAVPAALTRGAVRRGGRLRRLRRAAVAAVPVLAAVVVVLTVMSVQATAPTPAPSAAGPVGGANAQGWQLARPTPLSPRGEATVVGAGREVLVFGGSKANPCPPNALCVPSADDELRDGAAYDLDHDRWRRLAPAPVGLLHVSARLAGGVVYVLTEGQRLFGYSIAEDRWTSLPKPPTRVDSLVAVDADHLVGYHVAQGSTGRLDLLYDVATQSWTAMPRDPLAPSRDRNLIATGSGDLVLVAVERTEKAGGWSFWRAAVWSSKTHTWRELPRSEIVDSDPAWWWAAGRVVNPSTQIVDELKAPAGGTLDPVTGIWGSIPERNSVTGSVPLVATAGGDRVFYAGQVLDVASGTWWSVPDAPAAFPTQDSSAVVLGDRLIVFGGARFPASSIRGTLTGGTWVLRLPGR
jgi:hypothetical protein